MAPKRQPKKSKKVVAPPPSYLPRAKQLSRELLPAVGVTSLRESVLKHLPEFRVVNEYLPSLSFMLEYNCNLKSPVESFEVVGTPDGYLLDIRAKLRDEDEPRHLEIFAKRVHLVEPIEAMRGNYTMPTDGSLPQPDESWKKTLTKVHSPYNEAYVDALCAATLSRLVETGKSPHWVRFYGTFNARVDKYLYNLSGEYSSLRKERWFNKKKEAGLFSIVTVGDDPYEKPPIEIGEGETTDIACDALGDDEEASSKASTLSSCKSEIPETDSEAELEILSDRLVRIVKLDDSPKSEGGNDGFKQLKQESESESESSSSGSSSSGSRSSTSSSSGSESGSSESGSSESGSSESGSSESSDESDNYRRNSSYDSYENQCEFYAQFKDFPVQVTFHERCEGTMDSLLDLEESTDDDMLIETKEERWSAWIYQVIAALTTAQYHYGFVHNDLHTNNVMWCQTDEEFLYYKLGESIYYRVPTYGNLMKIIDFGRASFWLENRTDLIITDSYDDGNDAAGQYNCPPYYDKKEPRVDPNPSFDLCRLAVSMFDALYTETPGIKTPKKIMAEETGRISYETDSDLYNLLWLWLTDDQGKNILRTPNDNERFPDFDLYKHIAKYAKNCIPHKEAKNPYFDKQYRFPKEKIPVGTKIWEIPCV